MGGFSRIAWFLGGSWLALACNESSINLNVNPGIMGAGYSGSASIPIPPLNAQLETSLQGLSNWTSATGAVSSCPDGIASSTCNPPNAVFSTTVAQVSDPVSFSGASGSAAKFEFDQSPAYATAIWGHEVVTNANARNFIWDFYLYVTSTNYFSTELDLYTSLNNGQRFMMGSQCNRQTNSWDTWSEANQAWVPNTNIPCNQVLPANQWVHVIFYNTLDSLHNTYTYKTLRINNTDYILNQVQSTKSVGWPDGLIGVQIQIDANSSGAGVNEYFENMQVFAW